MGDHGLFDHVSPIAGAIMKLEARNTRGDHRDPTRAVALLLGEVRGPICDEEPQVASVRRVDAGVIDLIHDAVGEREPDAARTARRSTNAGLRTARPPRLDP